MTNKERADDLLHHIITSWNDVHKRRNDTVRLILAHDDEIRRECADRAVKWYNEPDNQNYMERYDDDEYWNNALTAAIIGKEVRK